MNRDWDGEDRAVDGDAGQPQGAYAWYPCVP